MVIFWQNPGQIMAKMVKIGAKIGINGDKKHDWEVILLKKRVFSENFLNNSAVFQNTL